MFSPKSPVRLGCVKYLNARPLIHGWNGPVTFDHPAVLCRALASGQLDVALVSSYEFLRDPIYSIVDRVAIASDGPVYSVVLVHDGPLEAMREAVIDPASQTSVNLLRVLFPEVALVREGEITSTRGRLIIGDQAIAFRREAGARHKILDLGGAWKERIGLPFVYALWLIRPEFPEKEAIAAALRSLGEKNCTDLDSVIMAQPPSERAFCAFYFRECLRFSLGEAEKKGLQTFAELCAKPFEPNLV